MVMVVTPQRARNRARAHAWLTSHTPSNKKLAVDVKLML
jgi:hypothetical protein